MRSEYNKKLAKILLLDEGIIRDELRHFARLPEQNAVSRTPIRQAVVQHDNALLQAGRIVIRTVWQDIAIIHHLEAVLPIGGIASKVQQEILLFLKELSNQGKKPDDVVAAQRLSEEAMAELSKALVENTAGRDETDVYNDSLMVLRKAYLNNLFALHSRKAESLLGNGDKGYIYELEQAQKIKEEMEELQVE